jgi:prepilin-type N-terminal cleavage/methylation domain-containing protein
MRNRPNNSFPDSRKSSNAGLTLIELILTVGIILILSSAAIPMFRMTIQHRKESELRYDLREMRNAIDRYKDDADKNLIRTEVGSQNYPPDLQTLVDGVSISAGGAGGGVGGISASALAGASGTGQFGSAGTPQLGAGQPGGASPGAAGGASGFGSSSTSLGIPALGSAGSASSDLPSKVRYLRKIPVDPLTGKPDWGLRAVQDDPDSDSWGGHNVFDVYSQSQAIAMDGSKYSDW